MAGATAVLLAPFTAIANTSLKASISGELRYDSNAGATEVSKSDYIASISPSFEIADEGRRLTLTGLYKPVGLYYFRDKGKNTVSHQASAGLRYGISPRSELLVNDSVTYSKESMEAVPNGIESGRGGVFSNTFSAGLSSKQRDTVDTRFDISSALQAYDNPELIDSRADVFGATLSYGGFRLYSITSSYRFTNYNFHSATGDSSTAGHSLNFSARSEPMPTVTIEGLGGVFFNPDKDDEFEWEARASIKKSFRVSALAFDYNRQVSTSSGLSDELSINQNLSATWVWSFMREMEVAFFGNLAKSRTIQENEVDIESWSAGVKLLWHLAQNLTLGMGYNRFEQASGGTSGSDLTRNIVFLNFTATPYSGRY